MIKFFANIGSDASANWHEIPKTECLHFTGADATETKSKPIARPEAGYVWSEAVWLANPTYTSAVKVENWVKPSASSQAGLVFKCEFANDLMAAPVLSAFDDEGYSTWQRICLAGTQISKFRSLLKAYVTGRESAFAVPARYWATVDSGRFGNANPNALCGNESFIVVPFVPKVGEHFTFTVALAIPADADYGRDNKYDAFIAVTFVHV